MTTLAQMHQAEVQRIGGDLSAFAQTIEDALLTYYTPLHSRRDPTRHARSRAAVIAMLTIWADYRSGQAQTPSERALGQAIEDCISDEAMQNISDDELAA